LYKPDRDFLADAIVWLFCDSNAVRKQKTTGFEAVVVIETGNAGILSLTLTTSTDRIIIDIY
jgi:hypothetical protein